MKNPLINRAAARAVLAEIQKIADDSAERRHWPASENEFARGVLARLLGSLEARVPSEEWNSTDVFRARRAKQSKNPGQAFT